MIATPGATICHQYPSEIVCVAAPIMSPQSTEGNCTPSPNQLSVARISIALPIWKVTLTTIVPIAFGAICRTMARSPLPPITCAACTYSRTRNVSASALTSRAVLSHEVAAITSTSTVVDGVTMEISKQQQHQRRDRDRRVDDPHHDGIDHAAEVTRGRAPHRAQQRGKNTGTRADFQ